MFSNLAEMGPTKLEFGRRCLSPRCVFFSDTTVVDCFPENAMNLLNLLICSKLYKPRSKSKRTLSRLLMYDLSWFNQLISSVVVGTSEIPFFLIAIYFPLANSYFVANSLVQGTSSGDADSARLKGVKMMCYSLYWRSLKFCRVLGKLSSYIIFGYSKILV